jgi:hypothetical protein
VVRERRLCLTRAPHILGIETKRKFRVEACSLLWLFVGPTMDVAHPIALSTATPIPANGCANLDMAG